MSEILRLKKSNCKNCYKCIRHCPVKSIRFSGNQAHIVGDECILCGQCFVVCPQNAKEIADDTEKVRVLLQQNEPVFASVAPSFTAFFEGCGIDSLNAALKKLGFYAAEETAVGATIVKREYDRLINEGSRDIIISSCCHSVNLLVEKYYPSLVRYLAPVVSPMEAHCADIKRRHPNAACVFIGPCLSKKDEAGKGSADAVMTFEELEEMLGNAGITLKKTAESAEGGKTRLFPTVGGILRSMECTDRAYTYLTVDGTENCKAALEDIEKGNIGRCFIEMSACSGSCIGGPVMEKYRNSPVRHFKAINDYAGKEDFGVSQPEIALIHKEREFLQLPQEAPSEKEINETLRLMGKFKPSDELNCGTCGYNTCREKAAAVIRGKAEINMCLPFLMEKSERFSANILNNTPNGILVLNEQFEVQQINKAAMKLLRIHRESDVLGEPAVRIIDPTPFMEVMQNGREVRNERIFLAEYDIFAEQTIVYDASSHIITAILRDITDEEKIRRQRSEIKLNTADIADKVVDKQMRIVQEIASLLGETAAETKIALTKLKESISDDENE